MPQPARRLEVFTESVIREMTRLSNRHGSINLAQGFPDFDPPAELIEALAVAIRGPHHQYAVTWGAPRFRQALARKHSQYTGLDLDADRHLVVTCGSTEAMMVAMMTACDPGDKVIVFSPFYENYAADAILSGAIPVHITLHAPNFEFDCTELRQAFADGAKAIVICNPSNPSGKVFTREELLFIAGLAEEFDAFVLMDEVYEHIVYAPHQHTYFATLPGMWERTLSCGSLSKTYSITGWRLGHVIAPENLISRAKKVHDFLTVGAAAPLQEAAVTALDFPASYYEELQRDYDAKRDLFMGYMRQTGLSFSEPQGAYYTLLNISPLGFATDTEAAAWMTQEVGVTGVPGSSFYREPEHRFIRFHFAKKEETLRAAGEKLVEGLRRGR